MSIFGRWEEFYIEMFDFKRKPVKDDETVIELYEKTGNYNLIVLLSFSNHVVIQVYQN